MKLLYITNGINGSGGLERVLSIKASYFAEHYGYEVAIISLNDADKNPFYDFSPKIKHYSVTVGGNPLAYIQSYKKGIQELVNTLQPDIISVCDDGLKAFFLPRLIKTKAKWIYERHASIELNKQMGIQGYFATKLMQWQLHRFNKFVVLTQSNIKEWSGKNIVSIPNPLSFFSNKENRLDSKKIIAVGSHSYNKGYDTLVDIWKNLEHKFPDWELHIYGKVDKEKQSIKKAQQLNLKHIIFHKPYNPIQEKFEEASIMVLPSRSEGFGMVLIEAMACGVPCIAFDCPSGPRDIIKDAIDGFLVENQNAILFQKKVEQLIENANLRLELGKQAKENVQQYQIGSIAQQWDQLFNEIKN